MLDPKDFKKHSDPVVSWIDHYLNHITEFPVKSKVAPGEIYQAIPRSAPLLPESMEKIMEDLDLTILPGITHWQHPGFHAYSRPTLRSNLYWRSVLPRPLGPSA